MSEHYMGSLGILSSPKRGALLLIYMNIEIVKIEKGTVNESIKSSTKKSKN